MSLNLVYLLFVVVMGCTRLNEHMKERPSLDCRPTRPSLLRFNNEFFTLLKNKYFGLSVRH